MAPRCARLTFAFAATSLLSRVSPSCSSDVPPGANAFCPRPKRSSRARRDWNDLDDDEKELFVEAIETAVDRGVWRPFVDFHADERTAIYAHDTCAFPHWHRRFASAMENALRDLAARFACLALPYWNLEEDFRDQNRGLCDSFGTCSRVARELGGRTLDRASNGTTTREHASELSVGRAVTGRPLSRLRDDHGEIGVVRSATLLENRVPLSCSRGRIKDLFRIEEFAKFGRRLQRTVHDHVHDAIGGTLPTMSSPADPLFYVLHSTIDMYLYVWEECRLDPAAVRVPTNATLFPAPLWAFYETTEKCAHDNLAQAYFPRVRSTDEFYVKVGDDDVRDDPIVGKYFRDAFNFAETAVVRNLRHNEFTYETLPRSLREVLTDPELCPNAAAPDWRWAGINVEENDEKEDEAFAVQRTAYLDAARDLLFRALKGSDRSPKHYWRYVQCRVRTSGSDLPPPDLAERLVVGDETVVQDEEEDDEDCTYFLPDDDREGVVGIDSKIEEEKEGLKSNIDRDDGDHANVDAAKETVKVAETLKQDSSSPSQSYHEDTVAVIDDPQLVIRPVDALLSESATGERCDVDDDAEERALLFRLPLALLSLGALPFATAAFRRTSSRSPTSYELVPSPV